MRKIIITLFFLFLISFVAQTSFAAALENYDALMQEALSLRKEARFDEAEKLYSLIISENPEDVDALVGRGFCSLHHKDLYRKAEEDFQNLISIIEKFNVKVVRPNVPTVQLDRLLTKNRRKRVS